MEALISKLEKQAILNVKTFLFFYFKIRILTNVNKQNKMKNLNLNNDYIVLLFA